jgi:hypothetical protein
MVDAFTRMHSRLLARLGQEALLRGLPVIATLDHGVAVTGQYGEITGYRSFATLHSAESPKVGDALTIAGKSWIIDAIDQDDGYTVNVVLR